MSRWKFTIEYNGGRYAGWQRQEAGIASIQGAIEQAIFKFCAQNITLHVAGRTDAGVHARGQVAHADLAPFKKEMDGYEVAKAINAHLRSHKISIVNAQIVEPDFHARFQAVNKLYRYRILNRACVPALERGLLWHCKRPLHVKAMHEAAQYLLGYHDFTTFRDSQCQAKSPLKTLDRLDVRAFNYDGCGGREIVIEAEGRSFLHHQVRNMVGTLALVGKGKWEPLDVKTALEARDRTKGGPTAPAEGLYLVRIDYPVLT